MLELGSKLEVMAKKGIENENNVIQQFFMDVIQAFKKNSKPT